MWKFKKYSASQILREMNRLYMLRGTLEMAKMAIFEAEENSISRKIREAEKFLHFHTA